MDLLLQRVYELNRISSIEILGVFYLIFDEDVINARLRETYEENPEIYPEEDREYLENTSRFAFLGYIDYDVDYPAYSELKIFYLEDPKVGELKSETLNIGNLNPFQIVKMGEPLLGYVEEFPIYYRDDPFDRSTGENIFNEGIVLETSVTFVGYDYQLAELKRSVSSLISKIY